MFTMLPAAIKAALAPPPTGAYQSAVLALSPISYYRLGESSGTAAADLGSAAKTGTYIGTYTLHQTSLLPSAEGSSLGKSGTGLVTFPTTNRTKPFTIAMWIKQTSDSGSTKVLIALGSSGGAQLALNPSNKLIGGASGNFNIGAGSASIAANTNTFIVWTVDATGNYKYYINGSLDFSASDASTYGSSDSTSYIGTYTDGSGFPFVGNMQEVAVFDYDLTSTQISGLWTAAQP
jgi:hypothetical protein